MEELFPKGWLENIKSGKKIQLHEEEAREILSQVASKLDNLTREKSLNEYLESLPLDHEFKAQPMSGDFDFLTVQAIKDLESTSFTKTGKGEGSICIESQSFEEYYAKMFLSHLLYAWQELRQKPVGGDILSPGYRYAIGRNIQLACSEKVNLESILGSISISLEAKGKLSILREMATFLDEKSYEALLKNLYKQKKSTTIAANVRWAGQGEKHIQGLDLIKSRFYKKESPAWFHNDYVYWIFETYKDENGKNPFKTIKNDVGEKTYQGISRAEFSKKVAEMFRTDLKSPNLVRGGDGNKKEK